jgi:hypothetical protein
VSFSSLLSCVLQNKVQCLEVSTWQDKEKITELQLEYREQSTAYLRDKNIHTETITVAHKQLFSQVKEGERLAGVVADLERALAERDAAYKSAVVERDDCIREVQPVTLLQGGGREGGYLS